MAGTTQRGSFPRALALPATIALALLALPLIALISRANWATLWEDITSPAALDALRLSLITAGIATICCVIVGIPLAIIIARARRGVAAVLRVLVTVPLVLPPMVGGVALLYLFGRTSPVGAWLDEHGLGLPFTTAAVVIAQIFVALPFLVIAVEGSVRTAGTDFERTAAALGAGKWRTLTFVTLPLAANGIVAGVILSFARAVGEFGATALFAGNAPGVTQTMPLAIYTAFNGAGVEEGTAVALALLLLATVLMILLVVRAWRPGSVR
ncbi:ABC transporter permease [Microbacterium amylolyticum]|uniref:Molybdenum transport system permease n=1 Tax=Microbacterium amylolyticum TaxID=936337 RepID=A0ABS4ZH22_9MICO|nr:ABC transporter permease [Microbacterium amylolyticum]MBP2435781.1 molybdate transport system permease protein [Microbacterium amylolyticum]